VHALELFDGRGGRLMARQGDEVRVLRQRSIDGQDPLG
jgi:hypothetical protein